MKYRKFLIVREPMERLVSAFNDLFIVSDRKGLQRAALKIRKKRTNKKITFKDFILAVVLPQNKVGNVFKNFNNYITISTFKSYGVDFPMTPFLFLRSYYKISQIKVALYLIRLKKRYAFFVNLRPLGFIK